jgi:hypothetical protein
MSNRTPTQIISYTILPVLVILVALIVLLGTGILRAPFAISSVFPIILSILGSIFATLIYAAILFLWSHKRDSKQKFIYSAEQAKAEMLRLEQQASELEKQRTALETKQQSLIWQMEAAVLTKHDPILAVITAYQGVEVEIQRLVSVRYPKDISEEFDTREPRVLHNISLLAESIGPENVETIKQIYDLRNRIVHGEVKPEEISEGKAAEYVQRAIRLAGVISSLG